MSYWFAFIRGELLLEKNGDGSYGIPCQELPPTSLDDGTHVLNVNPMPDGIAVKTYAIDATDIDGTQFEMCGLRPSYYKLPERLYLKAGKCQELTYWDANTRFCGKCGAPLEMHTDISKKCPQCGKEVWPQLATAIIVLVSKGDEVVLVHAKNFKGNFFGLVAGFVETGETLEEAVAREVKEETNLAIKNIKYYASQPWPYPCGLMIGFYADYESGDIRLQQSELQTGGWFNKDCLPQIPEKLSIARRLIDHWLEDKRNKQNKQRA